MGEISKYVARMIDNAAELNAVAYQDFDARHLRSYFDEKIV
jgi:hypothetical protein